MALDDFLGARGYRPFTVTIAAPGVITSGAHGLVKNDKVVLATTGALPTGLSSDIFYFVIEGTYSDGSTDPDTFRLATTKANADAGTAITTSGSQSGVHYYSGNNFKRLIPFAENNK